MAKAIVNYNSIKELREYLEWTIDIIKVDHYKCDISSDVECYDDGPVKQHILIREVDKLLGVK